MKDLVRHGSLVSMASQQTFQDNPKSVLIYRTVSKAMITNIGKYSSSTPAELRAYEACHFLAQILSAPDLAG
jgi:hypothetical protein